MIILPVVKQNFIYPCSDISYNNIKMKWLSELKWPYAITNN